MGLECCYLTVCDKRDSLPNELCHLGYHEENIFDDSVENKLLFHSVSGFDKPIELYHKKEKGMSFERNCF